MVLQICHHDILTKNPFGIARVKFLVSKCSFKDCLDVWFCALWLTSWSMCLTDESVEDKLQQIISEYPAV